MLIGGNRDSNGRIYFVYIYSVFLFSSFFFFEVFDVGQHNDVSYLHSYMPAVGGFAFTVLISLSCFFSLVVFLLEFICVFCPRFCLVGVQQQKRCSSAGPPDA